MLTADDLIVRSDYRPTDKDFIYSSWLKSYKHNSYFAKRIRNHIFYPNHQKVLDYLMLKPTIQILIAHPKDDADTILGYLICENGNDPVVHFTFVKDAFRKMGIMRMMLKASNMDMEKLIFSHWTLPVDELIQKYPDMVYNPYAI